MKKRFYGLVLSLLLTVLLVSPGWTSTLNALPAWPESAVYAVVNLDKPNEVASRIANSYLFGFAAAFMPEVEFAGEWLQQFSVTSASVVVGMGEEGFSLHGAVQFTDAKKEILPKLARGDGEEGDLDALLNNPMPGMVTLAPAEGATYGISVEDEVMALMTVEGDTLLLGLTDEDLAAVKGALADEGKRMKLLKSVPQGSFFHFHDNGMAASEIQAESEGVLSEPVGTLIAEAGLNASDKGYDFSFFTNFASVFSLTPKEPIAPLSKGDRLLAGGGKPWLAMAGRCPLTQKAFDTLREVGESDSDVAEAMEFFEMAKQFGIDEEAIVKIFQTVGMVLGAQTEAFGMSLPGGYMYISGEKKEVDLLLPILEMAAREGGMPFEAQTKAGWTALYVMEEPVKFLMGIKDGVLLAGFMDVNALDEAPQLSDGMQALYNRDDLLGFLHLDWKSLRHTLLSMLDPEGPWSMFLSDMAEEIALMLEAIQPTVELDSIEGLASSIGRGDLNIFTSDADMKEIEEIAALQEKWSAMIDEDED